MTTHVIGCTGKRCFARFGQADRTASRMNRRDGDAHLEPYKCRHCGKFHVGEARSHGQRDKRKDIER
jgi:hypothetical protein